MKLPPELRVKILRPLLSVRGVIDPYPITSQRSRLRCFPQANLLQLCRIINAEASQILYGENIFKLNLEFEDLVIKSALIKNPDGQRPKLEPHMRARIWETKKHLLRHVAIDFFLTDVNMHDFFGGVYMKIPDFNRNRFAWIKPRGYARLKKWLWRLKLDIARELPLRTIKLEIRGCERFSARKAHWKLRTLLWLCKEMVRAPAILSSIGGGIQGLDNGNGSGADDESRRAQDLPKVTVVGCKNKDEKDVLS